MLDHEGHNERHVAADLFETHTGSTWRPRSGSMVNHRTMTAAMIDSRDSSTPGVGQAVRTR